MNTTTSSAPPRNLSRPSSSRQKGGLRYKFGLSITLLLTLTIIFISFFALQGEQVALRNEMEQRGITIARNIAANAVKPLLRGEILSLASLVKDALENKSVTYAQIVDDDNIIVAHNKLEKSGVSYHRPPGVEALENRSIAVSEIFLFQGDKNVDVAIPILLKKQVKLGEVHIGLSQTHIDAVIRQAVKQIIILAVIFVVLGIIVTVILVSIIVRPIKSLEAGAEIIGQGNLDYTIKVESQDEIGNLARSFNRMTADLKNAQKKIIEKEKMEQELETARKIQSVLLPKEYPAIEGFQIVAFYKSAKVVGGDYYDFHRINDKLLGITVADVSGKGVPGSLGMVMTRSILRSQTYLGNACGTLSKTNSLLFQDIKRGMFVTMFYIVLDHEKKTLDCSNAGHNPMILAHKNGEVELFNPAGIALGLDEGKRFNNKLRPVNIKLKPGDTFILYTDGVTEAMNKQEQEFTEERLAEIMSKNVNLDPQELSDTIINELMEFTADAGQHDDITLVTVKMK